MNKLLSSLSTIVFVMIGFIAGAFFVSRMDVWETSASPSHATSSRTVESANVPQPSAPAPVDDLSKPFVQVAENINPAVVQVQVQQTRNERRQNPFEGTPFEDFFRMPRPERPQPRQGLGSGAIIRSDGYIVTNNHVVHEADQVTVKFHDGSEQDAEIVGTDPRSDLAVLKVEQEGLPTIEFANPESIRTGQWVVAAGSPFDVQLGNSITAGIVSATGRSGVNIIPRGEEGLSPVQNFIQTDAAINPGNSGGPLVNLQSQMVGINTAIISRSGGNAGIGFAIPVQIVRNVTTQIIEHGEVRRGYLGISFSSVTPSLSNAWDVPRTAAQINRVLPDTPADEAGLQENDVIVAVDGKQLEQPGQLTNLVATKQPGDTITVTYVRDGERHETEVTLGERPDEARQARAEEGEEEEETPEGTATYDDLGLELADLTQEVRRAFRIPDEVDGVAVLSVKPMSPAYQEAELREGMVIVEANRREVSSLEDFDAIYDEIPAGETFLVRALAGRQGSFLTALTKPAE